MASNKALLFVSFLTPALLFMLISYMLLEPARYNLAPRSYMGASRTTSFARNDTGARPNTNVSVLGKNHKHQIAEEVQRVDDIKHVNYSSKTLNIALYFPFHPALKRYAADFRPQDCVYKNCRVEVIRHTTNGSLDADAVFLQGNRMPQELPVHRDSRQVFIFEDMESPWYPRVTDIRQARFVDFFNWTMTYRRDSDIPLLYGAVVPRATNTSRFHHVVQLSDRLARVNWFEDMSENNPILNHGKRNDTCWIKTTGWKSLRSSRPQLLQTKTSKFLTNECVTKDYNYYMERYKQKTKEVGWLVSHCQTHSKREKYIDSMSRSIQVDIYGKCSTLKCPQSRSCTDMITQQYKFYLAFENNLCKDYITEKTYEWFERDIIIVVRGALDYHRHLPAGTYINAADFKSPLALAVYLRKLGANAEEYIKILQRKALYKVIPEKERAQTSYCQLCRMLNHVDSYKKIIRDISDWNERPGTCVNPV